MGRGNGNKKVRWKLEEGPYGIGGKRGGGLAGVEGEVESTARFLSISTPSKLWACGMNYLVGFEARARVKGEREDRTSCA